MSGHGGQHHPSGCYLFAGGGTGGHLFPAIAIAEQLLLWDPDTEIHFAGTSRGLEARVIPEKGFPLHLTAVRGFARKRIWVNVTVPLRLLWSLVQCGRILHRVKPHAVIGTGGYVSGPMLFMAHFLGYPTLIQEQNSYPGVTTRLLARFVDRVHVGFAQSVKYFNRQERIHVTGNPVRDLQVSATPQQARQHFGLLPDRRTLLVFGGSQGARIINRALAAVVQRLMTDSDLQILWSSGKWDQEMVRQAVVGCEGRVVVMDFIKDMPMAYRAADVVLGRAGALTLAEINVCGLPAILIPLATAAGNHQEANARALAQNGSALVVLEKELSDVDLAEMILKLMDDEKKRQEMGAAARRAAFLAAREDLARSLRELAKGNKGETL